MLKIEQVPGVYHKRIGDLIVTALCDGYLDTSYDIMKGIEEVEGHNLMENSFRRSPPRISVNAYLVRNAKGEAVLVETGAGDTMGETLGHMTTSLGAVGITPADIKTVLLTHMHPDHSNGLSDANGKPVFPNAEIVMHVNEHKHWIDDGEMARVTQRKKERYFLAARRQLANYPNQLKFFTQGDVFPEITAYPIHGHTPGHTAYIIASGKDSVMIWGDTVHVPGIQIPHPEVALDFDSDNIAAIAARKKLFDMVASERMLVAGMHLDFPGFGYLSREKKGYRFHADQWSPEM